jgi:hypothetical protein
MKSVNYGKIWKQQLAQHFTKNYKTQKIRMKSINITILKGIYKVKSSNLKRN